MNRRGFTLLEVVLVCGILALATTWVLPRLRLAGHSNVSLAARALADALNLARDRAILSQQAATIVFDLEHQQWRDDDPSAHPIQLPPTIRFAAVTIGGNAAASHGQRTLALDPGGDRLPTTIDLRDDDGHAARVLLPPARSRAVVLPQERS